MNKCTRGFTLIETVVVITIIGIVAAVIGRILSVPIGAYISSKNRAGLALTAESAISIITRDLRRALPNSVRMPSNGNNNCIEMLPTNGGGRYRANPKASDGTTGKRVDFTTTITQFDILAGDVGNASSGDLVTIYNLGNGIPSANAYEGTGANTNTAVIGTVASSLMTLTAAKQFPNESPGQRFFTLPSTSSFYLCLNAKTSNGDGAGTLYQYQNTINATLGSCPTAAPSNASIVASNVSTCVFHYDAGVGTRNGIATMLIGLTKNSESIQLYREAHVNNVP